MADLTAELDKWTTVHRIERPAVEPVQRDPEEFERMLDGRRKGRMAQIDNLPAGVRALVHEYGYTVVRACMDLGVTQPRHIKHLVETVLNEFSPTRGSYSKQGIRTEVVD